jgi:predicted dehydrogenase
MAQDAVPTYGLAAAAAARPTLALELPYRPKDPPGHSPGIGLIGCGGISEQHLTAYRRAGYRVRILCDRHLERAQARAAAFFPEADCCTDYREVLRRDDVEVIDATPHPHDRLPILREALLAGKHVLSQKPFVIDLDDGERLIELADRRGVKLAVNQNGRWAPHFSYLRQAIRAGVLGEVFAAALTVHWNHDWIIGTRFEAVHHLILYDFGIHWFDMVAAVFPESNRLRTVTASLTRSPGQLARPPFLAQALVAGEGAQATLHFVADCRFDPMDQTRVIGTRGTFHSHGPDLQNQKVTLTTAAGTCQPALEGQWFPDGFHGAMAELLSAIREGREPDNSARHNLLGLALCFAALASADSGRTMAIGTARRVETA